MHLFFCYRSASWRRVLAGAGGLERGVHCLNSLLASQCRVDAHGRAYPRSRSFSHGYTVRLKAQQLCTGTL